MTERQARIRLNTNSTRRAGESFFKIPANSAATILNGCFQAFCESTARQSTSCLYKRELAWASALNCTQRSAASMPAVSWRQPSLDLQTVRLAFVLRLCAKFCSFAHFDGAVARSSSLTKVATSLPYALRRRRADQVFQVFLYEGCAVLGQSILAASPAPGNFCYGPSTISSRTFRNHEKNRGARFRPNL